MPQANKKLFEANANLTKTSKEHGEFFLFSFIPLNESAFTHKYLYFFNNVFVNASQLATFQQWKSNKENI